MDQSKLFYVLAYPGVLKIVSDWSCSGEVEVTYVVQIGGRQWVERVHLCMLVTHQLFDSELTLGNQACALFYFSCMPKCPPELELVVGSDVFLVSLSLRQQAGFIYGDAPDILAQSHDAKASGVLTFRHLSLKLTLK